MLYMDGQRYGVGLDWYMVELIHDWLVHKDLYGADEVEFKVVRIIGDDKR